MRRRSGPVGTSRGALLAGRNCERTAYSMRFSLPSGAATFLAQNPDPTEEEVRAELAGHLCRCTGYAPIVDSILAAAAALRAR